MMLEKKVKYSKILDNILWVIFMALLVAFLLNLLTEMSFLMSLVFVFFIASFGFYAWFKFIYSAKKKVSKDEVKEVVNKELTTNKKRPDFVKMKGHKIIANIGTDVETNKPFYVDIAKAPHGLLAGITGYGKGVLLQHLMVSVLEEKSNASFKMIICDFAGGLDYGIIKMDDRVKMAVNAEQTLETMQELWKIHEERIELFEKAGVKNVAGYNAKNKKNKIYSYLVFFDEYAILKSMDEKHTNGEIDLYTSDMVAVCRKTGIHLFLTTQRPVATIIDKTKTDNCPLKISFRVGSKTSSNIVGFDGDLPDEKRPHSLTQKGVCLVMDDYGINRVRVPYKGNDDANDKWLMERLTKRSI